MGNINHAKFCQLLYEKLIGSDQHSIKAVARRTNTPESTLYKYCEGAYNPPPEFITRLYNATGDKDFLYFIIDDTDQMLVDRRRGDGGKSILEEALDVAGACGKLLDGVQGAMEDGNLTTLEKRKIEKSINKAEKELEDLREKIKG